MFRRQFAAIRRNCPWYPQFAAICRNSLHFAAIRPNSPQFAPCRRNSPQFAAIRCNSPQFADNPPHRHFADTSPTLRRHFADTSPTIRRQFAENSPKRHLADNSPTIRRRIDNSPKKPQNVTSPTIRRRFPTIRRQSPKTSPAEPQSWTVVSRICNFQNCSFRNMFETTFELPQTCFNIAVFFNMFGVTFLFASSSQHLFPIKRIG